ncbi:MAG TPA: NAD(P)H-dependent oxidoreductase [Chlamydiales bacterium]|nr:NAD(P)H-dependent oxidoreductase [Chlamydiales bacterium]
MFKFLALLSLFLTSTVFSQGKVLFFAGSTREGSFNKQLLQEAASLARQMDVEVNVVDLKDYTMPIYEADLEAKEGMPINAKKLRRKMVDCSTIVIASPEYNHSVSPLLVNILAWTSRSEQGGPSREAFKGKKFILLSVSPGQGGGARGLVHLRDMIEDVGGEVVKRQLSISNAHQAFNAEGRLKDKTSQKALKELMGEISLY